MTSSVQPLIRHTVGHPGGTGMWSRYLLVRVWVQNDPKWLQGIGEHIAQTPAHPQALHSLQHAFTTFSTIWVYHLYTSFVGMKYGVTGPLATKRYAQPKKQLYKMMLQVPHTYPGGAYKKPLAFLLWMLKTDAKATKISPSLFVVSPSLFSNHLCSKPSMVSNMRVN